jgi:hypothetical protein
MKQMIGLTLVVLGFMAMAGAAGDCDGKCMEQANTIGEMLMVAVAGLISVLLGASLVRSQGE